MPEITNTFAEKFWDSRTVIKGSPKKLRWGGTNFERPQFTPAKMKLKASIIRILTKLKMKKKKIEKKLMTKKIKKIETRKKN